MNSPYHLITLTALIILGYALTWLSSHFLIFPKTFHRRLWNTILLMVFLITGLIGLLLTVQVNYKFELPNLDAYMVWHVDAGIALALVSIFHIYWHWKYYVNLLKPPPEKKTEPTGNSQTMLNDLKYSAKEIKNFAILLGLNTLIIQTLFLREFMVMFSGNELTIGIILFFWMTFTGIGALLPKKSADQNIRWGIIIPGLIILAGVIFVTSNFLRFKIFLPGEEIGLFQIIWFSALFLFPVCFLSGYLFPQLVRQYNLLTGKSKAHSIYSLETLGSVVGGLFFTFILGRFFGSFEILSLLLVINSIIFVFNQSQNKSVYLSLILISIILLLASTLFNIDKKIKQPLFLNQELINYKTSPFGDIAKTKQYEQINYFLNTDLLFNNQDLIKTEALVHFSMLQSESAKNVLVFGGNFREITRELGKYHVSQVDFIENNPVLYNLWTESDSVIASEHTLNLIKKDLRKYLEKSGTKYDAVILNLPSPGNLQANRYYTDEFYKKISACLSDSGTICFNLPAVYNYLNDEQLGLFSSVYNTVKGHFNHAEFFVGEGTYLVASNAAIDLNVGELAGNNNLKNEYVNPFYIDSWSMNQRNEDIKQQLIPDARLNFDFKPVVFHQSIKNWLDKGKSTIGFWIILVILILATILSIILFGQSKSALFLAGFTTSALEIIIIYIFQIIYGNVYQFIGLIIALFMLGITIGASEKFSGYLKLTRQNLRFIRFIISFVPILIIASLYIIPSNLILFVLILLFALAVPLLTGWLFQYANQTNDAPSPKLAGKTYFVDLLGAAIGVFLVSIFVLPQFGLFFTLLIISGVNLMGLAKE